MTLAFLQPPPELTRWQALTPEQKTAEVRQAMADGLTYAKAAEQLGATRVAIAGVIERSLRKPNPIRSNSGMKNQNKAAAGGTRTGKTARAKKARAKAKARPHQGFNTLVPLGPSSGETYKPLTGAWDALPGSSPVAIADHVLGCRWPTGENRPFRYCNEPVKAGGVYCASHAAISYREPPPRKDNGRRDSA